MYSYTDDMLESIGYKDQNESFSINLENNEKSSYNEDFLQSIYNEFPFRKLEMKDIFLKEIDNYYVVEYLNARYYFNKQTYVLEKETLVDTQTDEEISSITFTFETTITTDELISKP